MSLVARVAARRQEEQMAALQWKCVECGVTVPMTKTKPLCHRCYNRAWMAHRRKFPSEVFSGRRRRAALRQATLDEILKEMKRRGWVASVQIGSAA